MSIVKLRQNSLHKCNITQIGGWMVANNAVWFCCFYENMPNYLKNELQVFPEFYKETRWVYQIPNAAIFTSPLQSSIGSSHFLEPGIWNDATGSSNAIVLGWKSTKTTLAKIVLNLNVSLFFSNIPTPTGFQVLQKSRFCRLKVSNKRNNTICIIWLTPPPPGVKVYLSLSRSQSSLGTAFIDH